MRLVKGSGDAEESATNRPRHPSRITALYPILCKGKILSHTPRFGVLRQFSRLFTISESARCESENRAGPVMRYIAGNSDSYDVFCITGHV